MQQQQPSVTRRTQRTTVKEVGRTGRFFFDRRAREFSQTRKERKIVERRLQHDRVSDIGEEMSAFTDAVDHIQMALRDGDEGELMAGLLYFRHALPIHKFIPKLAEWCFNNDVVALFITAIRDTVRFTHMSRCDLLKMLRAMLEFDRLEIVEQMHQSELIEWIMAYFVRPHIEEVLDYEVAIHCFLFLENYFSHVEQATLAKFFLHCQMFLLNLIVLLRKKNRLDTDLDFIGDMYGMLLSLCENIAHCNRYCQCVNVETHRALHVSLPNTASSDIAEYGIAQIELIWTVAIFAIESEIFSIDVQYMAAMIVDWFQNPPFRFHIASQIERIIQPFVRFVHTTCEKQLIDIDEKIQDIIFVFLSIIRTISFNYRWSARELRETINNRETAIGCVYQISMSSSTYRAHIQAYAVDVFLNALANNPSLVEGFVSQFDDGRLLQQMIAVAHLTTTHLVWRRSVTKFIVSCIIYAAQVVVLDDPAYENLGLALFERLRAIGAYDILCLTTKRREVYDPISIKHSIWAWMMLFENDTENGIHAFESEDIEVDFHHIMETIDQNSELYISIDMLLTVYEEIHERGLQSMDKQLFF